MSPRPEPGDQRASVLADLRLERPDRPGREEAKEGLLEVTMLRRIDLRRPELVARNERMDPVRAGERLPVVCRRPHVLVAGEEPSGVRHRDRTPFDQPGRDLVEAFSKLLGEQVHRMERASVGIGQPVLLPSWILTRRVYDERTGLSNQLCRNGS